MLLLGKGRLHLNQYAAIAAVLGWVASCGAAALSSGAGANNTTVTCTLKFRCKAGTVPAALHTKERTSTTCQGAHHLDTIQGIVSSQTRGAWQCQPTATYVHSAACSTPASIRNKPDIPICIINTPLQWDPNSAVSNNLLPHCHGYCQTLRVHFQDQSFHLKHQLSYTVYLSAAWFLCWLSCSSCSPMGD